MSRTTKQTKQRVGPDTRFRTNDTFSRMFAPPMPKPWTGVVIAAHPGISGCWKVRIDDVPAVQFINEKFMEVTK